MCLSVLRTIMVMPSYQFRRQLTHTCSCRSFNGRTELGGPAAHVRCGANSICACNGAKPATALDCRREELLGGAVGIAGTRRLGLKAGLGLKPRGLRMHAEGAGCHSDTGCRDEAHAIWLAEATGEGGNETVGQALLKRWLPITCELQRGALPQH